MKILLEHFFDFILWFQIWKRNFIRETLVENDRCNTALIMFK
jgi:hypothetical protein